MLHLRPPLELPLLAARRYPRVDPVFSDVVLGCQRYLQRWVLLLSGARTAERVQLQGRPPAVVQGHGLCPADAARQPPQPLFVIGNGAWKMYLG
jgi:hypothetical protein